MFKTKQYWLGFLVVGLATPAVLLFSPIIVQLGQDRGLSEEAAHWAIIIGAVGSAAGRLAMPALSDKIGRRATDLIFVHRPCGAFSGVHLCPELVGDRGVHRPDLLLLGRGGGDPQHVHRPVRHEKHGGKLRLLALGMSAGSIGFPLLAKALNLELGRHFIAIGAALAGLLCLWALRPTQGEKTVSHTKETAPQPFIGGRGAVLMRAGRAYFFSTWGYFSPKRLKRNSRASSSGSSTRTGPRRSGRPQSGR